MAEPSDLFELAIDALMVREFDESPRMASIVGRDGFDHRLDDLLRLRLRTAGRRMTARWLRRFQEFDPHADLIARNRSIGRALVISRLDLRVALAGWEEWRRTPEGYLETGITELFLMALRSEDDLTEAAVARLHGIGAVLEEGQQNLDPSLASRLIVERSLAECVANIGFARSEVGQLA